MVRGCKGGCLGSTSIFIEFSVLSMVISQVSQFSKKKYFVNLQTEYPAAYILAMAWLNNKLVSHNRI